MQKRNVGRNCTGVELKTGGTKVLAASAPQYQPGDEPAYKFGWWDIASEEVRESGTAILRGLLADVENASKPLDRCARLIASSSETYLWLQHVRAVMQGLRSAVDEAPMWYDGYMLSLAGLRQRAESIYLEGLRPKPSGPQKKK